MISVTGLECYVCDNQDDNVSKCLKTIKTCEHHHDRCLSIVRWSTTPYWSQVRFIQEGLLHLPRPIKLVLQKNPLKFALSVNMQHFRVLRSSIVSKQCSSEAEYKQKRLFCLPRPIELVLRKMSFQIYTFCKYVTFQGAEKQNYVSKRCSNEAEFLQKKAFMLAQAN